ncbi:MAG: CAP domain-containing protein [Fimbriimonadaceae bacterium]
MSLPCVQGIPRLRAALALVAACLLLGAQSAHAQSHDIFGYQRAFGPQGKVKLSRPKLVWEVWPGDGSELTRFHVSVNGVLVKAEYDPTGRRIWYRWHNALEAGTYNVEADATIDDALVLKKQWRFTITDDASPDLPTPGELQLKAVSTVNDLRAMLGLPSVHAEPSLCAAAQGHASYMRESGHVSHEEAYVAKNYIGYSLNDRLAAFGFVGGAAEDVGYLSAKGYAATIRALFDAPYHRVAFLQPGSPQIGAGVADNRVDLDFEMNQVEGLTVSPCDGQHNVPSTWNGFESPNPLRAHGGQAVTGYPIVIAGFGTHPVQIETGTASLTLHGRAVACYINTPQNDDDLRSTLLLIPVHPLSHGTYRASADLTMVNGTTKHIDWSFTVD